MKFVHLSDLHIGKIIYEYSMLDEQKYILDVITECIQNEKPDAVIIAGDVYDKSTPPIQAVQLLDDFITKLSEFSVPILVISGNHDSSERLAFGSRLMQKSNVYIKGVFSKECEKPLTLYDDFGEVNIYSVPFIRPVNVNNVYGTDFTDYTEAFRYVTDKFAIDTSKRNILIAHQSVMGAFSVEKGISVGGIECISKDVFEPFDYTALGHIHRPQNVGSKKIRYCGTPLKYSEREIQDSKSLTIVEMGKKGDLQTRFIPLKPKHNMRPIRGKYADITSAENITDTEDYVYIELTDDEFIPDARARLSSIYPRVMEVRFEFNNIGNDQNVSGKASETFTPYQLFSDLFIKQHDGGTMTEEQSELLRKIIDDIWQEENNN